MKNWVNKEVRYYDLDNELNAFSKQEYEIYSVTELLYGFRIIAYKEIKTIPEPTSKPSEGKSYG